MRQDSPSTEQFEEDDGDTRQSRHVYSHSQARSSADKGVDQEVKDLLQIMVQSKKFNLRSWIFCKVKLIPHLIRLTR